MGNNNSYETKRIGTIQLKTYDGSTKTFTHVWYALSMKKCFILLGVLESMGFAIIVKYGILKVMSSKLVVMKEIRKVNFYDFQGSTIVGLATTTIDDDEELETKGYCICIWDMQVKMLYKI